MKKKVTCLLFGLLSITMLAGCSKYKISMNARNIENNTIGIKKNNVIQSAVVEQFDEPYYQEDELEEFIDKEITKYNTKVKNENGEGSDEKDAITKKSFHVDEENASVVMNYNTITDYSVFNNIEAKILTAKDAATEPIVQSLPNMTSFKDDKEVTTDSALNHDAIYVLIIKEPVEVKVEGTILYYANATKEGKKSVQTQGDKEAVIVYTLE